MGGIVTQSRDILDSELTRCVFKRAEWSAPQSSDTFYSSRTSSSQTTTSYRSGSRYPNVNDEPGISFRTRFDNGHPFDTLKLRQTLSHRKFRASNSSGSAFYEGLLMPNTSLIPSVVSAPSWGSSAANLTGSKFISETIPTNSVADLAVSLGELISEQKIASFVGSTLMSDRLNVFRKAGAEYLNVTFGWLPFVADLEKVLIAVVNSKEIIDQYAKDSDKQVRRRRRRDPVTTSTPETVYTSRELLFPVSLTSQICLPGYGQGKLTHRTWTTVTESFSAAYTYHLETGGDFLSDFGRFEQLANKLLGTRITPDVLWELVPFSWLVDWVANVGVLTSNLSAFSADSLVLRYGYAMRQYENWSSCVLTGIRFYNSDPGPISYFQSSIRKTRVKSTPYGFGLNPSGFSARQWATLAALGLTKAPNVLR